MWKHNALSSSDLRCLCFSPLAGIRYVETKNATLTAASTYSFSPLAGIRYVETVDVGVDDLINLIVSVPLRGLDMWKLLIPRQFPCLYCFSPLAGIRYVETPPLWTLQPVPNCFSPLAGIRYVET